jgi:hypothetical protein
VTPATAPQFRLLPSINEASNSMTPSIFGNPPKPNESSIGLSSSARMAFPRTSSLFCPADNSRTASLRPCLCLDTRRKNCLIVYYSTANRRTERYQPPLKLAIAVVSNRLSGARSDNTGAGFGVGGRSYQGLVAPLRALILRPDLALSSPPRADAVRSAVAPAVPQTLTSPGRRHACALSGRSRSRPAVCSRTKRIKPGVPGRQPDLPPSTTPQARRRRLGTHRSLGFSVVTAQCS